MRILVCGSRTYTECPVEGPMRLMFDGWLEQPRPITIIHGAAKGADSLAGLYAARRLDVEEYPADWDRYGKRAGYVRNQQMLVEGQPDLVVAFVDKPLAESRGTAMMVDLARKAGVPTWVVSV